MLATGVPRSDALVREKHTLRVDLARLNASHKLNESRHQQYEKKRKMSHATRKEMLEEEIKLLESGVAVMKTRGLLPQLMVLKDPILSPMFEEHAALQYAIQTQQLRAAKMQAALSQCFVDQQFYPLYSHVVLSNDWDERRSTLLSMQKETLRNALEFVMALSPDGTVFSENKFETAEGDLCCVRCETIQFPGVKSLEQVFDAVSFYKNNMEFIISEQLGHITLRDDYDDVDSRAVNTRILSTDECGITTEGNVVAFRHLFGRGDDGHDGEPCAVMTVNSVDEDKRYPYISSERVRKDISGAVVLTARRSSVDDGESELVVTMRRNTFLKLRRPEFPLSQQAHDELRDGMSQWCDLMLKTVRGIVYSNSKF